MPARLIVSAAVKIRLLGVVLCSATCGSTLAQSISTITQEIQTCVQTTGFYPDRLYWAGDSYVADRLSAFTQCLNASSNPKDPEVLFALGVGYKFEPMPHADGYMENARKAFCAAAEQGYVLAQEECAAFSPEDKHAQYRWTLSAALNGSSSAQANISLNAWGDAASREDQAYNNYLVNYLACHPAMFRSLEIASPAPVARKEVLAGMKAQARVKLANLAQCQREVNKSLSDSLDVKSRKEWESRASKQLNATLENMRQQVKRYPGLSNQQLISP
ncbi:MAG: hypothetical protein K2X79_05735 [Burkholderiaceae bacterium]|nr:hypothetical protein [Burkholderiaceae bacterium]